MNDSLETLECFDDIQLAQIVPAGRGNSLSQHMRIALLETAQGNDVNLAIEQGHQIKFQMNLIKNLCLWTEFNEEVNVRTWRVIATGY